MLVFVFKCWCLYSNAGVCIQTLVSVFKRWKRAVSRGNWAHSQSTMHLHGPPLMPARVLTHHVTLLLVPSEVLPDDLAGCVFRPLRLGVRVGIKRQVVQTILRARRRRDLVWDLCNGTRVQLAICEDFLVGTGFEEDWQDDSDDGEGQQGQNEHLRSACDSDNGQYMLSFTL
eukprot:366351-Chlamydomonas_euryale.AAC.5